MCGPRSLSPRKLKQASPFSSLLMASLASRTSSINCRGRFLFPCTLHIPSADGRVGKRKNKSMNLPCPCHRKNEATQSGPAGRRLPHILVHCGPDGCSLMTCPLPGQSPWFARTTDILRSTRQRIRSHILRRKIRKACQSNHQPHPESVQPKGGTAITAAQKVCTTTK